jgi:hypothetical protein
MIYHFSTQEILVTKQAAKAFGEGEEDFFDYLERHELGDWGEVGNYDEVELSEEEIQIGMSEDTANLNFLIIKNQQNGSVMSIYKLKNGTKIWIITCMDFMADSAVTTILLPSEY